MSKHKHHRERDYGNRETNSNGLGSIFQNFDLNSLTSILGNIDINTMMPIINTLMGNMKNIRNNATNSNKQENIDLNSLFQNFNNNFKNDDNNNISENNNIEENLKDIIDQFSQYYNQSSNCNSEEDIVEEGFVEKIDDYTIDTNNVEYKDNFNANYLDNYENDEMVTLLESLKNIANKENIKKIDKIIQKYIEENE
ncbi:hypothetical protein [Clostridium grantii]|uniref:Uncharacterized protein n=1 Tax=Clostridium grantii DSM 8605 TaxID=1121316 RepID=A0A1M5WBM7_9CLOT|nr:hypothetical protein [Clostridium grantii]SHH84857.1 hypothetical protein SAMN02745207_02798 [Clostridium grantii DSM 8605]